MKVITWNCNMAFRKKAVTLLAHKPDLLIIPECECPEKLIFEEGLLKPTNVLWYGNNQHKGLGILSYGNYKLKPIKHHNETIRMVIPISVTGGDYNFTLFAIWANNPADPEGQYVEQVWKAIHEYKAKIKNKRTMLIGDFNSNTIWDRKSRIGNHSTVVDVLAEKKIFSTYHLKHKQEQGKEKHPTFYLYRHESKPYHLDYCFVSEDLAEMLVDVKIGKHKTWSQYSDHVPMIVNFKVK